MTERMTERNEALFADVIRGAMLISEIAEKYDIAPTRVLQIAKDEALRQGIIDTDEYVSQWGVRWLRKKYDEAQRAKC